MVKAPEIRHAKKEDLESILDLVRDYESYDVEFAKRYYDLYFQKDQIVEKDKVYVAKADGRTIGVIEFTRDYFANSFSYWVRCFVVHKDYRGKKEYNVAQRLLQKVQAELAKRKIKKLFVSTEDTNARAKSFFARNGFRIEGVLRDYYSKGEDQLILSKFFPAGRTV
jgi:N-acetylglutamate synthase-like GNAT family acetyltransferase